MGFSGYLLSSWLVKKYFSKKQKGGEMSEFKGNSPQRMIELYQGMINGKKYECKTLMNAWVSNKTDEFSIHIEYRKTKESENFSLPGLRLDIKNTLATQNLWYLDCIVPKNQKSKDKSVKEKKVKIMINSNKRMAELYTEREDGFEHDYKMPGSSHWEEKPKDHWFIGEYEYRKHIEPIDPWVIELEIPSIEDEDEKSLLMNIDLKLKLYGKCLITMEGIS